MIDTPTLITYLAVLLGFVLIPGPAVLLTLARASTAGTRTGLATGLGIAVGDLAHTLLAIAGISAIVATSAVLFSAIKYLGAAYLVYLGIRAILDKVDTLGTTSAVAITPRIAFRQAVIAEILNPKSALFFLAFLPQFVSIERGSVALQLFVLGLLFVAMGLLTTVIVALGAGRFGALLRTNLAVRRWQGRFVGGIYCGLGIRLALQER